VDTDRMVQGACPELRKPSAGLVAIELKIRGKGNSLYAVFPQEAVDRLRLAEGDRLVLAETPDGYRMTSYDPEFERQMALAEGGLQRYRRTLRDLAG